MVDQELQDFITRIDERTLNIWRVVEKLEIHQSEANGYSRQNMENTAKNTTWISALRWVIGIAIAAMVGWLGRLEGWWW